MVDVKIEDSWKAVLKNNFEQSYFSKLTSFVKDEYKTQTIFPAGNKIFSAFDHCPFAQVKVVILGQDPYHGPNQANGLCFSVNDGVPMPPSLLNIFKELKRDLNIDIPPSGNLERWAKQGVLLLNATLTVQVHQAGSHQNQGWETFTDEVFKVLNEQKEKIVFMLWGNYAQKKGAFIDVDKHLVLKSVHPSPLSAHRGFIGCGHFSAANQYLEANGLQPISW